MLCPDIMGLRPLFDEMAQRLADENHWVVVSPEPFAGREELPLDERMASVGEFDDLKVLATLQQAADATGMHEVGILGFCMGGMWALKASATGRFHHAVSFYGMIRMPEQLAERHAVRRHRLRDLARCLPGHGAGRHRGPVRAAAPTWPISRPPTRRSRSTRAPSTGSSTTPAARPTAPTTRPTPGPAR